MERQTLKDDILTQALRLAPEHGWNIETIRLAARKLGQDGMMADALFMGGIAGATQGVSEYFDRMTMMHLGTHLDIANEHWRVRDKIARAVMTRFELMAPYKEGLKVVMGRDYGRAGARALWRSADCIWVWAGDKATDYNHYTKRALLMGVVVSTTLYWFQDNSVQMRASRQFLERRISNVLEMGKMIGMAANFIKQKAV